MTTTTINRRPFFPTGQLVATPGVLEAVVNADIMAAFDRHAAGDWGDCCLEDRNMNDDALDHGNRLLSVYHDRQGTKFWIITEADRSVTTILLPSEYYPRRGESPVLLSFRCLFYSGHTIFEKCHLSL